MRNHPKFKKYLNDWQEHTGNFIRNPYLKNPKLYIEDQSVRAHNHLNSDEFASFLTEDYSIEITESSYTDSLLRNRMLNELFHEATPVILQEDDLNSMKYSIENRSPFLDVNLFDFAYSIPSEHLIQDGYGKFVLREAMKGILNEKVRLDRRKKGFNASINSIVDLSDNTTLDYLLSDSPVFDIIHREKIENLFKQSKFENSYKKFIFNFINTKIFLEKQTNKMSL
jgi:asparagine synthase (glutamine-hydrolysing)